MPDLMADGAKNTKEWRGDGNVSRSSSSSSSSSSSISGSSSGLPLLRALRVRGDVPEEEALRLIFQQYDRDGSGTLQLTELEQLVADMAKLSIEHARSRGASEHYVEKAREALLSQRGQDYVRGAAMKLHRLRHRGGQEKNPALTWEEFAGHLNSQFSVSCFT